MKAMENLVQMEEGDESLTRDLTDLWQQRFGHLLSGCQDPCSSNILSTSVCI